MEGAEEGECSSEDEIVQYVPLERPIQAKPSARNIPGKSGVFQKPVRSPHNFSGSVFIFCGVSDSKNPGPDPDRLKLPIKTEAESKEKHGVWDLMLDSTITSPYVDSIGDSNTCSMGNSMPESALTLCQSRFYPPVIECSFVHTWFFLRYTISVIKILGLGPDPVNLKAQSRIWIRKRNFSFLDFVLTVTVGNCVI